MEFVASLSQGHTAAAQCGLFTHKSDPVIFEPPCTFEASNCRELHEFTTKCVQSVLDCTHSVEGTGCRIKWGKDPRGID